VFWLEFCNYISNKTQRGNYIQSNTLNWNKLTRIQGKAEQRSEQHCLPTLQTVWVKSECDLLDNRLSSCFGAPAPSYEFIILNASSRATRVLQHYVLYTKVDESFVFFHHILMTVEGQLGHQSNVRLWAQIQNGSEHWKHKVLIKNKDINTLNHVGLALS